MIVWDAATGARLSTLTGQADAINSVSFSPDGRILATTSHDRTVWLWDTATWKPRAELTGHTSWVRNATFSPDGRLLATTSHDSTVIRWEVATGARLVTLAGHIDPIFNGVAFSPDGRTLAIASGNNTVVLWDVDHRVQLARLAGHTGFVRSVAFSPDGRTLASAGADATVILWEIDVNRPRGACVPTSGATSPATNGTSSSRTRRTTRPAQAGNPLSGVRCPVSGSRRRTPDRRYTDAVPKLDSRGWGAMPCEAAGSL